MVDLVAEGAGEELGGGVDALLAVGVEAPHGDPGRAHRRAAVAGDREAALLVSLLALALEDELGVHEA